MLSFGEFHLLYCIYKAAVYCNIVSFLLYHIQVVVHPNILVCGWLEKDAKIQVYNLTKSEKKKLSEPPMQVENVSNAAVSNQILFFLNMDGRKNKRMITHISYDRFFAKYLCVSAAQYDTLLEALEKDGRFVKPESWTLNKTKTKVPLDTKACHAKNYIFDVHVNTRKRTPSGLGGCASESGPGLIKKEKLEEDDVINVSSLSPVPAKVASPVNSLHKIILESAQLLAKELLAKNQCENLTTLIEKTFSKPVDQSKSVWLMKELVSASKYVGRIYAESGRFSGTCFLVTEDVILTNYHVYQDIKNDIKNLAPRQPKPTVKVAFNYLLPNQTTNLDEVEVNMEDVRAQNEDASLDYIFLGLKDKRRKTGLSESQLGLSEDQPGLSKKISLVNPKNFPNKILTIVGHPAVPACREKSIDTDCRLISEHTWRPQLLDRLQRPHTFEFKPLFTCKEEIMSDKYKHKIAYDTSFFDGSSGSPVFDDQGKIIAMHTCGWVLKNEGIEYSVMEFAIPMEAIYNDCYHKDPELASLLFPSFSMNVDD